ncbi:MAG: hypothetical protein HDR86_09530 [Bacteroides sp.]|nr:hypothetical protein [Bacteroides sp.]
MEYQPLNTYIVKYSYPDYHFESEVGVFCDNDPCGTPPSEKTLKAFFDDGGEPDIIEIIEDCVNTFSETELLSREAIEIINNGYGKKHAHNLFSINLLRVEKWEDKKVFLSYIGYVYNQLPYDKSIRYDYQQRIIRAIKDCITCYSYQINREAVEFILDVFSIKLTNESIPNQLRKLIDEEAERERRFALLCKITTQKNTPTLRHWLDKLNKHYHFTFEDNQRKLACILFKFLDTYPYVNSSVKGKLSTGVRLLADYFGITAPTFRLREIQDYIDEDAFTNIKSNPKLKSRTKSFTYLECLPLLDEALWRGIKSC